VDGATAEGAGPAVAKMAPRRMIVIDWLIASATMANGRFMPLPSA